MTVYLFLYYLGVSYLPSANLLFHHPGIFPSPQDMVSVAGQVIPFLMIMFLVSLAATRIGARQRRAEDDLAHQKLECVIQAAGVGMLLVDPEMKVRWFSKRTADWFNWGTEVIDEKCPRMRPEGPCSGNCIVERAILTGEPQETERHETAGNGSSRYFRLTAVPIKNGEGKITQVVETVSEITSRKSLEAETFHAAKLSILGRMTTGIIHEIGNPISSLAARLKLMEDRQDPAYLKESLAILNSQTRRISRIVQGVTGFARPGQRESRLFEMNPLISEAIGIIRLDPRAKKVNLLSSLDSPSPEIYGNRDQILQVFLNLLLNAVDALPDGGMISVDIVQGDDSIRTIVSDTGMGMNEETRKRVFEPFFSTKKEGKGTGLGLSISKELVEAHGGRIEMDSEPGLGTRFEVILPAAEARKQDRLQAG